MQTLRVGQKLYLSNVLTQAEERYYPHNLFAKFRSPNRGQKVVKNKENGGGNHNNPSADKQAGYIAAQKKRELQKMK